MWEKFVFKKISPYKTSSFKKGEEMKAIILLIGLITISCTDNNDLRPKKEIVAEVKGEEKKPKTYIKEIEEYSQEKLPFVLGSIVYEVNDIEVSFKEKGMTEKDNVIFVPNLKLDDAKKLFHTEDLSLKINFLEKDSHEYGKIYEYIVAVRDREGKIVTRGRMRKDTDYAFLGFSGDDEVGVALSGFYIYLEKIIFEKDNKVFEKKFNYKIVENKSKCFVGRRKYVAKKETKNIDICKNSKVLFDIIVKQTEPTFQERTDQAEIVYRDESNENNWSSRNVTIKIKEFLGNVTRIKNFNYTDLAYVELGTSRYYEFDDEYNLANGEVLKSDGFKVILPQIDVSTSIGIVEVVNSFGRTSGVQNYSSEYYLQWGKERFLDNDELTSLETFYLEAEVFVDLIVLEN